MHVFVCSVSAILFLMILLVYFEVTEFYTEQFNRHHTDGISLLLV